MCCHYPVSVSAFIWGPDKEALMRKVYLDLRLRVIAQLDDGVTVDDFVSGCYVTNQSQGGDIIDTTVVDYEVTDSK
jgi:hypothetical protein